MKILLTGSRGFIGRNIIGSKLAKVHQFLTPDHRELDLTNDIEVAKYFSNNEIDCVIHAAGKPGHRNAKDPSNIFYADMRMFMNLLQQSHRYKKMIVLGSGAVYDQRFNIQKAHEEDYKLHVPVDEHALFRRVAADYAAYSEKIIELRIFGVFGPHEDYAIRFISNAICKTIHNMPISIKQDRRFDYLYVDDLYSVLEHFLNNPAKHKAYNVTPDQSVSLIELAHDIQEVSETNIPIIVKEQGFGLEYSGDNSRLRQEMGDLCLTNRIVAIKQLYEWYLERKQDINTDLLLVDK